MLRRAIACAILMLALAACNFSVPQATPTVRPSITPSLPPERELSPTPIETATPLPTAILQVQSPTPSATFTPSDTPTITPSSTITETPTLTETSTATFTPSATITDTLTPSPTLTPSLTITTSITPPPQTATITLTPTPSLTSEIPTEIILIVPTTDVPVQDITAIPRSTPRLILPTPAPPTDIPPPATAIPRATIVAFVPQGPPPPPLPAPNASTRMFGLSTNGGGITLSGVDIGGNGGAWRTFAQNPANPYEFVVVNDVGLPFVAADFRSNAVNRLGMTNFTQFHYQIGSEVDNDKPVRMLSYAPDGTLGLLIDGDKNLDDGVWMYSPITGVADQLLRECWHPAICENVYDYEGLAQWEAIDFAWSPDSGAVLIQLDLPREGRTAWVVAERSDDDHNYVPPARRYDYATWSPDSQRIVVSGRAPDGSIVVGWLARDGRDARTLNMRNLGFNWTQDAVEYNGRIYALASQGGRNGSLLLVDEAGNILTGALGSNPDRVSWSPDNSAVLLVFGGRHIIVNIAAGTVEDISAQVGNARSIDWVLGG